MIAAWLLLFVSSVAWVFIIGFQSRAVNSGQYLVAAPVSFLLGFLQVQVLGDVLAPDASWLHTFTYCFGGMLGIVGAMWFHKNILPRFLKEKPHAQSQGLDGPIGPPGPQGPAGRDCQCYFCRDYFGTGGTPAWSAVH